MASVSCITNLLSYENSTRRRNTPSTSSSRSMTRCLRNTSFVSLRIAGSTRRLCCLCRSDISFYRKSIPLPRSCWTCSHCLCRHYAILHTKACFDHSVISILFRLKPFPYSMKERKMRSFALRRAPGRRYVLSSRCFVYSRQVLILVASTWHQRR